MEKLILVSKNAGIVSKDELNGLALDIQNELNIEVHFYTPKKLGTQVTFWDVIEIWIGQEVAKTTVKALVEPLVKNFIKWAKGKLAKEKKPRPKSFTIYGPDGNVLRSSVVDEKGEAEDTTNKFKNYPPKAPSDLEPFF